MKTENLTPWPKEVPRGISIEAVFECGGHTYYQVRDAFNTFAGRGMKQLEVYEEWQNRLTNERLKLFIQAMKFELNKDKIELTNIADLINKMEERINFPIPTSDLIIKMAGVAFFDETEDPCEPDEMYAREVKIPAWRAEGVDDFFMAMRLSDLVPFPSISKDVFNQVSKVLTGMIEMEDRRLEKVLQPE